MKEQGDATVTMANGTYSWWSESHNMDK